MRPVVHGGIHFPRGRFASKCLEAHFVPFGSPGWQVGVASQRSIRQCSAFILAVGILLLVVPASRHRHDERQVHQT